MRAERILSRWLEPLTDFMHAKRQRALLDVVGALMKGRRLWVTALGRALPGPAKFKHRIKRVDRLLGNHRLWSECQEVYRRLAYEVVGPSRRVVVLVDWTYVNNTEAALVASVPMSGRAQIIYAQVHGQKRVGNRAVQRTFLERLQQVLPTGRQIVVVTDAGFGRSWFDDVTACGLHFVGRLTRNNTIRPHGVAQTLRVHDLFARATLKPRSLGPCEVTRDHPIEATLVVQRMKNKGRHRPKFKTGGLHPNSALNRCYKRRAHEPWVLACSAHELSASCISRIYASRMRCEQAFRDGKNLRFGLGLGHVSVRQTERLHVLFLLVALALWAASLLGCLGEQAGAAKPLQANTVTTRRAFSMTVLGLLILEHKIPIPVSPSRLRQAQSLFLQQHQQLFTG
jgi:hypothetical protein